MFEGSDGRNRSSSRGNLDNSRVLDADLRYELIVREMQF